MAPFAGSTRPFTPGPTPRAFAPTTIRSSASSACSRPHSSANRSGDHRPNEKPRFRGAFAILARSKALFLDADEARKLLLEAGQPAAAVEQLLLTAGPGRVRLGVDIKVQHVARLAPCGAGGELGAVGHDDLDGVI